MRLLPSYLREYITDALLPPAAVYLRLQVLHGSGNHYHFETVPGVLHDTKAFMEFTQSPAAQGEGEGGAGAGEGGRGRGRGEGEGRGHKQGEGGRGRGREGGREVGEEGEGAGREGEGRGHKQGGTSCLSTLMDAVT